MFNEISEVIVHMVRSHNSLYITLNPDLVGKTQYYRHRIGLMAATDKTDSRAYYPLNNTGKELLPTLIIPNKFPETIGEFVQLTERGNTGTELLFLLTDVGPFSPLYLTFKVFNPDNPGEKVITETFNFPDVNTRIDMRS